jgi:hypothetical protein
MPGMLQDADHEMLYRMRAAPGADQGMLAPFEHRAFAREWAQESPVLAGVSLPVAVPLYQLAKLLGLQKARTPASLDELFAGYHGMAEGMLSGAVPSAHAETWWERNKREGRPVFGVNTAPEYRKRVRGEMPQRPAQPQPRRTPSEGVRG